MNVRLVIVFLFIALFAVSFSCGAQVDSVCIGNTTAQYSVQGFAGSTYNWDTGGDGIITNGQGTNSITVEWSAVVGVYTLSVVETSSTGCVGDPQTLSVVVYDLQSTTNITICSNQVPYIWNGNSYSIDGSYNITLTSVAGCDSIATLNLVINDVLTSTESIAICSNQTPFIWNGNSYSTDGTYNVTLTSVAGCDSVATLNLVINDVLTSVENITICSNQVPYIWNGNSYNTDGSYNITLTSVAGCDSIATLNLVINDVLTSTENITICSNQTPYIWNGNSYSTDGTYNVTLTSFAGCDSIATLNLVVNDVLTSTENVTICSNQTPYVWNGNTYSIDGSYNITLTSVAGCDSIVTLNLVINDVLTSTENVTICSNQIPYVWNGNSYNTNGTYSVTLTSVAGCDSVATLNLVINDVLTSTENVTICSNQTPYVWNGNSYNTNGNYNVTLTSVAGCDSIATLNLVINDVLTSTENITICSNQVPYIWNGNTYNTDGTYNVTLTSAAGCDSIATLNLVINDVLTSTENVTICSNQTPYSWNGNSYNTEGIYNVTLISVAGCDSIATLNLVINDVLTSTENITICSNQTPYIWNGNNYNTDGTYNVTLTTVVGCDSIATLNLVINDVLTSTENVTICSNQIPYVWNGNTYNTDGTYHVTLTSVAGCDSVATLNLVINDVLTSAENITICSNQVPYIWNGNTYNTDGTYNVTLTSVAGCDSIATLNLVINDVLTSTENITICSNQTPYIWNGNTYITDGTYNVTLTSVAGCDSVATLNLVINDVLTSTENVTICSNQVPYIWNGNSYSTDGTYNVTLTSVAGCDSVATLNLVINDVLTSTENVTICSNQTPYVWNGNSYNADGTYNVTLTSVAGCDSIATLNLVINDVLTSTENVTICSNQTPYVWNSNSYNAEGTYNVTLTSVAGCDSVATLNLVINDVLTSTENVTICSNQVPYIWNGNSYSTDGTYNATLTSVAGCDSVATLILVINDALTSTENVTICSNQAPYVWNGNSYVNDGTYNVTLTSVAGCDSIATLNLVINDVLTSTENITICSNQTPYIWNGNSYSTDGTYNVTLTSVAGCDSVATLNLVINDVLTSVENITICSNQVPYIWNGNSYNTDGSYNITLTSVAGCDSIATLNLVINDVFTSTENVTICSNQTPYVWNSNSYNAEGTYNVTLTSVLGCDSIATLNLVINDVLTSTESIAICSNQTPYIWNGNNCNTDGTYNVTLTSAAGCDSIATLILVINDVLTSTENVTICSNQTPYIWNGNSYNTEGIYNVTLTSVLGCDSIATLNLVINDVLTSTENIAICSNQTPYIWNGNTYITDGTYNVTLTSVAGCDSVATLNLVINDVFTSTENVTICSNQTPYVWNSNSYNAEGTYNVTLTSVLGCDSIATLNLVINDVLTSTENVTICSNQVPYIWNGNTYNTDGTYNATLTSVEGCDSIATLILTINLVTESFEQVGLCPEQLPYNWNGNTYNAPGAYQVVLNNSNGCDSIAHLTLDVYNSPAFSVNNLTGTTILTCDVLQIEVDIDTEETAIWMGPYSGSFNQPGWYSFQVVSSNGCIADGDIVITQDINPPLGQLINLSGTTELNCNFPQINLLATNGSSYSWNGNTNAANYTVSSPGLVNVQITGPNGCSVNQFINISSNFATPNILVQNLSGTDLLTCNQTAIELLASGGASYNWSFGSTSEQVVIDFPGLIGLEVVGSNGCISDTTLTIYQNIVSPSPTILSATICEGEEYYLQNGSAVQFTGDYEVIFEAWNGCDSIVTTQLVVLPEYEVPFAERICDNQVFILPDGQPVSESGTYTTTLESSLGCDSTIVTILDVVQTFNLSYEVTICAGDEYALPNGEIVDSEGLYAMNMQTVNGCDSITSFSLNIQEPTSLTIQVPICNGESYQLPNGTYVNTTGYYPTMLSSVLGCDSIVVTHLIVGPSLQSFVNASVCSGELYILPDGSETNASGVYTSNLVSIGGCDSLVITNLSVQPDIMVAFTPFGDTVNVCFGDSILLTAMGASYLEFSAEDIVNPLSNVSAQIQPQESQYCYVIGESGVCSGLDSLYINVLPLPEMNISSDAIQICLGDSVVLIASGADEYQWTPALNNCEDCESGVAIPNSNTTYTVTGTINGCDSQESISIQIADTPQLEIMGDSIMCEGEEILLQATGGMNYLWNTGDTTSYILVSPISASEYAVTSFIGACSDETSQIISVFPNPIAEAGQDTTISPGGEVLLIPEGGGDYSWSPSEGLDCVFCENPLATPEETTTYCVEVVNEYGCIATDCLKIEVTIECETFFAPNVFAPSEGGHELNNCYRIFGGECFDEFVMRIYNRWGQVVFESTDPDSCWDGTFKGVALNAAVFAYTIEAKLLSGASFQDHGNITLIR